MSSIRPKTSLYLNGTQWTILSYMSRQASPGEGATEPKSILFDRARARLGQ